jgi:hypothetical protein
MRSMFSLLMMSASTTWRICHRSISISRGSTFQEHPRLPRPTTHYHTPPRLPSTNPGWASFLQGRGCKARPPDLHHPCHACPADSQRCETTFQARRTSGRSGWLHYPQQYAQREGCNSRYQMGAPPQTAASRSRSSTKGLR